MAAGPTRRFLVCSCGRQVYERQNLRSRTASFQHGENPEHQSPEMPDLANRRYRWQPLSDWLKSVHEHEDKFDSEKQRKFMGARCRGQPVKKGG